MSTYNNLKCLICYQTSLELIDLNLPIGIIAATKLDIDSADDISYLECLEFCSKLNFAQNESNYTLQSLCCDCVAALESSYQFLKQVQTAYERIESMVNNPLEASPQPFEMEFQECIENEDYTVVIKVANDINLTTAEPDQQTTVDTIADAEHAIDIPQEKVKRFVATDDSIEHIEFCCTMCQKRFRCMRTFRHHCWKVHKSKLTQYCKLCCNFLDNGISIHEHLKTTHSEIVGCDECDYQCLEQSLSRHKRKAHGTNYFACNHCSKTFNSSRLLRTHLELHKSKQNKTNACSICGKHFTSSTYMSSHMKTHNRERKIFECHHCEKKYLSKTALESHLRFHNGKTIQCKVCEKSFVRPFELKVHMRFHTRDFPETCNICGMKFAIKSHLTTHMWRHQGLKLQCEECDKLFNSLKALKEHSFVHSSMPYKCRYCTKGYPSMQKFKVHLKKSHDAEINSKDLQFNRKKPMPLLRNKGKLVQVDASVVSNPIEI